MASKVRHGFKKERAFKKDRRLKPQKKRLKGIKKLKQEKDLSTTKVAGKLGVPCHNNYQVKNEQALFSFKGKEALTRRKTPVNITQADSLPGQNDDSRLAEREKMSRSKLRKPKQKAKNDEKQIAYGEADALTAVSQLSASENLKTNLSQLETTVDIKARIAEIGTSVLANPEKHLDSLTELQGYYGDGNTEISIMAILSLLAVFRDIIPGYRIRLPTEKELAMQVSKEVKKLRDFETKLLKYYQRYVQFLVKSIKSRMLGKAATRCVTGLLEAAPHFNFCDGLLSVTIPLMDSVDKDCRKMSCDAVKHLFLNEGKHGGSATVDAVEMIADLVKTEQCILRPDVIEVFLSLSFHEGLSKPAFDQGKKGRSKARAEKLNVRLGDKAKATKKGQFAATLREEVAADFRESRTMPEAGELQQMQTQTLSAIFETYFRILKASLDPVDERLSSTNSTSMKAKIAEYGPRPLLGPCLDGLARFSHLVSVEFMGDLLALLKRLAGGQGISLGFQMEDANSLNFTDRLHCCVVAFKIVKSNLDALNVDLRDFFVALYNLLPLQKLPRNEKDSLVLAEALQIMLWESRQHDMQRVAAFIKRLATHSLRFGPAEAMSALVTVRQLLQRYQKCRNLLDNDDGVVAGILQSLHGEEKADPDLSGALSSILWELTVLSRHYHPAVSGLAEQISKMLGSSEASQASLTPKEALLLYSTNEGGFNPSVQLPKAKVKRKYYASHPIHHMKAFRMK